jgi:aspartyl protease family protein
MSLFRKRLLLIIASCLPAATFAGVVFEVVGDRNGMFYVDGAVGNAPLRFLVDTGASMVTVPRTVANKAGEFGTCKWIRSNTANGPNDLCMRRIAVLRVGPIVLRDVDVLIMTDDSSPVGLLGMSVLRNMQVSFSQNVMRLSN